jgi:hypothetical protein
MLIDQDMSHCHTHAVFDSIGYDLSFDGRFFNNDLSAKSTIRIPLSGVPRANAVAVEDLGDDFPDTATGILWNF